MSLAGCPMWLLKPCLWPKQLLMASFDVVMHPKFDVLGALLSGLDVVRVVLHNYDSLPSCLGRKLLVQPPPEHRWVQSESNGDPQRA